MVYLVPRCNNQLYLVCRCAAGTSGEPYGSVVCHHLTLPKNQERRLPGMKGHTHTHTHTHISLQYSSTQQLAYTCTVVRITMVGYSWRNNFVSGPLHHASVIPDSLCPS